MKKTSIRNELITLTQAAEAFGFSGDYFRRLAEKGRLDARKSGRQWLTTAGAVEIFLESREERGVYKKQIKRR
jgi:excisionase family DNA binding protein